MSTKDKTPEGADEGADENVPQEQTTSLTDAIREAFSSIARERPVQLPVQQGEVRKLDYAPDGGRFIVRGQVVDHDGKPVDGYSIVNGAIVKA